MPLAAVPALHLQADGSHQIEGIALGDDSRSQQVIEADLTIFEVILEVDVLDARCQFIGDLRQGEVALFLGGQLSQELPKTFGSCRDGLVVPAVDGRAGELRGPIGLRRGRESGEANFKDGFTEAEFRLLVIKLARLYPFYDKESQETECLRLDFLRSILEKF